MIRNRRRRQPETPELNITAFMNLMVILVPFLLITAVFTRLTIIELNLPSGEASENNEPPKLQLEVSILPTRIVVGDRAGGLIQELPNVQYEEGQAGSSIDDYQWEELSDLLAKIKARSIDTKAVTLRIHPAIHYDIAVRTMDTVRAKQIVRNAEVVLAELFPNISIGNVSEGER
ncbi:MAG: biopolymer transporter ExbD [Gammaproteobacteria bacterium]|nr:biopolymer transporter ExbD [Gammaproteobacteria bacterium]